MTACSSSAMMTKITASTSGMMMTSSRLAVCASSQAIAGLPPTSDCGAPEASRWRRPATAVVPAGPNGSTDSTTE